VAGGNEGLWTSRRYWCQSGGRWPSVGFRVVLDAGGK
jgi:hypothetical protein